MTPPASSEITVTRASAWKISVCLTFSLALVALITLSAQLFCLFSSHYFSGSVMAAKCTLISRLNDPPPITSESCGRKENYLNRFPALHSVENKKTSFGEKQKKNLGKQQTFSPHFSVVLCVCGSPERGKGEEKQMGKLFAVLITSSPRIRSINPTPQAESIG